MDDAQKYLDHVIAKLRAQAQPSGALLIAVLEHISQYIDLTKREIGSLRAADAGPNSFSTASEELGEVVNEAAKATNEIMSAAETIERLDPQAPDRETALRDAVTRIYVACAFQDITGQRVAKVIKTLREIEAKIVSLARVCGGEVERIAEPADGKDETGLLNGPQVAANAKSQADIDRLFEDAG
jgi:chemotaxis protein CheZ